MGSIFFLEFIEFIFILFGFLVINERCLGLKSEIMIFIFDVFGMKKLREKMRNII